MVAIQNFWWMICTNTIQLGLRGGDMKEGQMRQQLLTQCLCQCPGRVTISNIAFNFSSLNLAICTYLHTPCSVKSSQLIFTVFYTSRILITVPSLHRDSHSAMPQQVWPATPPLSLSAPPSAPAAVGNASAAVAVAVPRQVSEKIDGKYTKW